MKSNTANDIHEVYIYYFSFNLFMATYLHFTVSSRSTLILVYHYFFLFFLVRANNVEYFRCSRNFWMYIFDDFDAASCR